MFISGSAPLIVPCGENIVRHIYAFIVLCIPPAYEHSVPDCNVHRSKVCVPYQRKHFVNLQHVECVTLAGNRRLGGITAAPIRPDKQITNFIVSSSHTISRAAAKSPRSNSRNISRSVVSLTIKPPYELAL